MTVRRYSTNCSLTGVSERERGPDGARRGTPTAAWGGLQEDNRLQDNGDSTCPPGEEDVIGSRRSLQEYVHKTRFIFLKLQRLDVLVPSPSWRRRTGVPPGWISSPVSCLSVLEPR